MTKEYIDTLRGFATTENLILMLISPIIGGILGMLIAKVLFKKHFKNAGVV